LTVREYARIQSFPDDFEFKGKYTTGGERRTKEIPRYTQIGNAIPPLFGEQSGLVLKLLI
jgi:DNA (cytosine-5)-methyltransferase 1